MMDPLRVLFVLLFVIGSTLAIECSSHTVCSDCVVETDYTCGWCNSTDTCVLIYADGSTQCTVPGVVYRGSCPSDSDATSIDLLPGFSSGSVILGGAVALFCLWKLSKLFCASSGKKDKEKAASQALEARRAAQVAAGGSVNLDGTNYQQVNKFLGGFDSDEEFYSKPQDNRDNGYDDDRDYGRRGGGGRHDDRYDDRRGGRGYDDYERDDRRHGSSSRGYDRHEERGRRNNRY
eukprot:TRINITY_DN17852_c0_g1_i1.p1 TRINITY_DN17852_c0_g1~~TRINITY_DN17852_c0_g1_i1.p1  ORF type:complete len:234 (+),score=24.08 TRINITY_DN17852_c0_g1_i1:146-847(+)